eukprot:TRINITY_DN24679_c0_g1_i5.p1 TRINITY_DN24679_c0_g1~~TRINITY_DN24679_c0_g1_i5.p1  ORF type:complete len:185 (-),score=8.14 TRINITY_DN24679_c0_g1_i5:138-692(-)
MHMNRIFGDRMAATPPSGRHVFFSCGFIEGIFLFVNISTLSPFIFEMCMPYHLKYTGLMIGWWGGTYLGLNMATYGPLKDAAWITARSAVGVALMLTGAASLVLADGVGKMGPWPSYWTLVAGYTGMAAFDFALHHRRMIPPWLLRWKMGVSGVIVASLLFGVLKGKYLEKNAKRLILEAGNDD